MLNDTKKNRLISKGWMYDVFYVLNKLKLNKYCNINELPNEKCEGEKLIRKTIHNH